MLFPSLPLAQRLEAHDLWNAQEHVRTQALLYPETGAVTQPVGGGLAVFAGVKAPLSGLYGLGLWEPVTPAHLDEAAGLLPQPRHWYRVRNPALPVCRGWLLPACSASAAITSTNT